MDHGQGEVAPGVLRVRIAGDAAVPAAPEPDDDEGRVGHLQDGLCRLVQPDVRPEATPEEADPGGRRQPGDRADAIGAAACPAAGSHGSG